MMLVAASRAAGSRCRARLLYLILLMGILLVHPGAAAEQTSANQPAGKQDPPAAEQPDADDAGADDEAESEPSLEERLDALLAETLPDEAYRETSNCLSIRNYRSAESLGSEYLLFSKGSNYWLNRLKHRCPGLGRDVVLSFEPRVSRLCKGDTVYPVNRMDLTRGFDTSGRPIGAVSVCTLGEFEKISVEQAAVLREIE